MPAKFIKVGEPAHDAERQALRFIVEGLPDAYTVYGNPWIVDHGSVFELDAVVVAPHAIYVVELKAYRGDIGGNDNDWYVPAPIRSPLKLNRRTAQVLGTLLKSRSVEAARPFVEGFVFLSHANSARVVGPASQDRVHTRRTIVTALQDAAALERREGRKPPVDDHSRKYLHDLLVGADPEKKPARLIREWQIEASIERADRYVELFATHRITSQKAVLRVYDVPALDDDGTRKRAEELFRWEAQVLRRIGEHPHVLHADAPFIDEAGLVLPFEPFSGITLGSWIDKHGPKLSGPSGIRAKFELWKEIAEAIDYAHGQGVVHRLLRPEVILVEDKLESPDLRVTGFEFAKQTYLKGQTIAISSLGDDRRRWAAPEVVRLFSDADARSDQFSLGAILGHLLAGRPLFDSTEELLRRNGQYARLRDIHAGFKQSLDQAVATMLERSSVSRFKTLREAIAAVELAVTGRASPGADVPALDPENLAPGTRLGSDYEVKEKIGAGGLATVYAARHLVSGETRALKIARPDPRAEVALRAEHEVLKDKRLLHPNIVLAIDITSIVPDRKTLILERVKGVPLAERLRKGALAPEERRQYAEHLLAAIDHLEQVGVVHKDIKPDNLVVGPDGLTLIDFSLAGEPADSTLVGTALYRDPALARWSPVADRFAAALCLFELYVGRHAFDGQVPFPGDLPHVDAQDFDRPALAEFFRKALSPNAAQRFPSAAAMRAGLLNALGARVDVSEPPSARLNLSATGQAPLSATGLSGTSLAVLRRAGITTQAALVALDDAQITNLPGIGNKKRDEIFALRRALIEAGVTPDKPTTQERHPLFPTLIGDETSVQQLQLGASLTESLERAGFTTIGRLADATRDDLRPISGVGPKTVAQIVQGMQRFSQSATGVDEVQTLDAIWDVATRPLQGQMRLILDRLYGIQGRPATQVELQDEINVLQPNISQQKQRAILTIDRRVLDPVVEHVEGLLVAAGGLLRIDEAAQRLRERWPVNDGFDVHGLLRALAEIEPTRIARYEILDDEPNDVLARPLFAQDAIDAFLKAARETAQWPPQRPDAARNVLQSYLPEYPYDPLGLAIRLVHDLRLTDEGELFEAPVRLEQALKHVLHKSRPPLPLAELRERIASSFGDAVTPPPSVEELLGGIAKLQTFRVDPVTQEIDVRRSHSIEADKVSADPLPPEMVVRDAGEVARDLLRAYCQRDGFRLVVAPPEDHLKIGRSVAQAIDGATFVSFEDAFFRDIDAQVETFERAERFAAQKPKLRREAEQVIDAIVREHGKPGCRVVLGDLALLGICDATHLVRKLYDLTSTGGRGFWAVVIPGVVHQRQPLFNEKAGAIVFSIEGATLPIAKELRIEPTLAGAGGAA
jgi:serine/threonine protein kinase